MDDESMEKKKLRAEPAALITECTALKGVEKAHVLDLACGSGRNGLWFAQQGHKITFLDRDLSQLERDASAHQYLEWDLELEPIPQLPKEQYDIILVFNYLHRPLFPQIAAALKPGGIIVYETFIEKQAEIGRPRNPDFLLKTNELKSLFDKWECLQYFEGEVHNNQTMSFKAQLIARKPQD